MVVEVLLLLLTVEVLLTEMEQEMFESRQTSFPPMLIAGNHPPPSVEASASRGGRRGKGQSPGYKVLESSKGDKGVQWRSIGQVGKPATVRT